LLVCLFVCLLFFFRYFFSYINETFTHDRYRTIIRYYVYYFCFLFYPSLSGVLLLVGGAAWWWLCSSSMYVMLSDRGRPRELVVVRKLCMERRSSRSSSVDLKARMTRSCKHTNTTRVSCEVCFYLVLGDV